MFAKQSSTVLVLAAVAITLSSWQHARAATKVRFDVSPYVACRDVTTPELSEAPAQEKVVEARIEVSTLVTLATVDELFYRFESPERNLQIVDYLPKTSLATDVVGTIQVERGGEQTDQLKLGAGGSFEGILNADVSAVQGDTSRASVRYEMLPPREMMAASGTMGRGTGAYFKLRPSNQHSLEGSREFVLVLRVPANWRGDYLRVVCQAKCHPRSGKSHALGDGAFLVPLHAEGDVEAQTLAVQLSQAEHRLLQVASARQRDIARRSQPTIAHELSLVGRRIPGDWLSRLAHRSVAQSDVSFGFERYLPADVREAAQAYQVAKRELHDLSGTFLTAVARPEHGPSSSRQ